jgi:pimeloyl-ACP methyl ester carboxylesterase
MGKPDLLLLHGALGASEQFQTLSELLEGQFTVHAFDFEGHGTAPSRDRPFRIEHFAENIITYLDVTSLPKTHIFGYSMGGYVAMYLTLRQPERVQSIATLGTKFRWNPETAEKEASLLKPEILPEKLPRFAETLARRHVATGWQTVLRMTADMMLNLGEQPLLSLNEIGKIQHRVRIGLGDRDTMVSVEESVETCRALPNGEMIMLPNTQHPLEKVKFSALAQSLTEFFI